MGIRCGITPRDRLPQVQLVQGRRRRDVRERHRARLRRRRAVAEDGHRRHRVQAALAARPTSRRCYDFGSKEIVAWSHIDQRPTWPSRTRLLDRLLARMPEGASAGPCTRDMGWQYQHAPLDASQAEGGRDHPEHVAGRGTASTTAPPSSSSATSRTSSSGAATWHDFESFKARPGGLHRPLEHEAAGRLRLKGLTPEEFRSQSLAA